MKQAASNQTRRPRGRVLALVTAALVVLPAGMAQADNGQRSNRVFDKVVVAEGVPADVGGAYSWSGDVFGTGVVTNVSYTVAVDEAGVAQITEVAVDESTLPEGATYQVWGPSSRTWERNYDDGTTALKFRSWAGAAFSLDGDHAGVFVKLRGKLGEEPSAVLSTVAMLVVPEEEEEEVVEEPVVDDTTDDATDDTSDDEAVEDDDDQDRHHKDRDGRDGWRHRRDGDRGDWDVRDHDWGPEDASYPGDSDDSDSNDWDGKCDDRWDDDSGDESEDGDDTSSDEDQDSEEELAA